MELWGAAQLHQKLKRTLPLSALKMVQCQESLLFRSSFHNESLSQVPIILAVVQHSSHCTFRQPRITFHGDNRTYQGPRNRIPAYRSQLMHTMQTRRTTYVYCRSYVDPDVVQREIVDDGALTATQCSEKNRKYSSRFCVPCSL